MGKGNDSTRRISKELTDSEYVKRSIYTESEDEKSLYEKGGLSLITSKR